MPKRGLGLVQHAGRTMVWGKGVVAGDFVFLSGAEARSDDEDVPVEGLTDRSLESEFYAARDGWLERNCKPLVDECSYASTLLIVGLAREDMLVEIDCIAYVGD